MRVKLLLGFLFILTSVIWISFVIHTMRYAECEKQIGMQSKETFWMLLGGLISFGGGVTLVYFGRHTPER